MLYFIKLFLTSIAILNVKIAIASEAKTGLPQLDLNTYPSLMFWSIISLIIGFILMKYLVTPNIKSILNSRETNIQNDLVKAKTSNQEAEKIKQSIIKSQEDIKSKSQKIISDAILDSIYIFEDSIITLPVIFFIFLIASVSKAMIFCLA